MDCLQFAHQVQALADDDLPPVDRLLMEDHARRCYACRERRDETERLFALLDGLERDPVPAGFATAVLQRVAKRPGAPAPCTAPARRVGRRGSAAAISAQEPLVVSALAAGLLALADALGLFPSATGTRGVLGQAVSAWYGCVQDAAAAWAWWSSVSWAELVTRASALLEAGRTLLGACAGELLTFVCGMAWMVFMTSVWTRPRHAVAWAAVALCAVGALVPNTGRAAAEREPERPRDEIMRLEELVEQRRQTLDSLLQHIETLPQGQIDKEMLERVHGLTGELREDRRRLLQLRDAVVPLGVEPPPAPRAPRPPRPRHDKIVAQNLVRFGENVEIRSGETVNGDAIVVDGDLNIDGHVEGDAIVLGGNMYLGRRASVNGQAIAIAGRVDKTPGAEVFGQEMSLTLMPGNFLAGTWPHWVSLVLDMFKLGFLLLVAGLFLAVVPDRMARAREQLGESFLKCFGVGLVVLFGGSFAVAVSVMLLSITFIGIPAALVVTFATGVLLIASLFVGVLLVGDRLQELLNFRRRAPWVSVALGLLLIMLPELLSDVIRLALPIGTGWGFAFFSKALVLVTIAAGLGAIVLTRLGAPQSGQSPQPSV